MDARESNPEAIRCQAVPSAALPQRHFHWKNPARPSAPHDGGLSVGDKIVIAYGQGKIVQFREMTGLPMNGAVENLERWIERM